MPPFNRFAPSKYKNQLLEPSKPQGTFTELPPISGVTSPAGRILSCDNQHIAFSLGNGIGFVEWRKPGKYGGQVNKIDSSSSIADIQFSPFQPGLLGVVSSNGMRVLHVNSRDGGDINAEEVSRPNSQGGRYSTIEWHPHARDLFTMSTDSNITIHTLESSTPSITLTTDFPSKQHYWTPFSGSHLFSHSTQNVISRYDPRFSTPSEQIISNLNFLSNRPSMSTLLDDATILVTGTSTITRTPILQIHDLRNPTIPKSKIDFPSSSPSSGLLPLVDIHRKTTYLIQSHSSSIYSLDLNSTAPLPSGVRLTSTILGGTLLPATETDVMSTEINRIYVASGQAIQPVNVKVERRSYLDFHGDLFPDCFSTINEGGSGIEWLQGKEMQREMVSLDPERQGWRELKNLDKGLKIEDGNEIEDGGLTRGVGMREEIKALSPITENSTEKIPSEASSKTSTSAVPSDSISSPIPETSEQLQQQTQSHPISTQRSHISSQPSQPIQPSHLHSAPSTPTPTPSSNYTRKFLTGTLHHPTKFYTSLPHPPPSTPSRLLHTTSTHLSFPLSGPGGRLAIIPLSSTGRNESPPIISNGSALVDFALSMFGEEVFCAGEDGSVTVWRFEGKGGGEGGELKTEMVGEMKVDKVVMGEWNPIAEGVVGVLCIDLGKSVFIVWDYKNMQTKRIELAYTAHSFSWSTDDHRIVIAGDDSCVHVIDPRIEEAGKEIWIGKEANNSKRGFKSVFCRDKVISVGFGRGSSRQICLYSLEKETLLQKIVLDTSPSLLIPHFDVDTSILFLWSKGSRQIHAYHLSNDSLELLPSFDCSELQLSVAFLPKICVDVKKVEVLQGLRMTGGNKIERFGFGIPRNRSEYFQDDIFVPTVDTSVPSMTAEEWFNGSEATPKLISMKPVGMIPLSQAPVEKKKTVLKGSSYQRILSEKEKEELAIKEMFDKAKRLDFDDEDIEGIPKRGNTDAGFDDDDWE